MHLLASCALQEFSVCSARRGVLNNANMCSSKIIKKNLTLLYDYYDVIVLYCKPSHRSTSCSLARSHFNVIPLSSLSLILRIRFGRGANSVGDINFTQHAQKANTRRGKNELSPEEKFHYLTIFLHQPCTDASTSVDINYTTTNDKCARRQIYWKAIVQRISRAARRRFRFRETDSIH